MSQLHSLMKVEVYIDNELMGMNRRTPTYSPYRFPERDKLQRRLFGIEAERRRLHAMYVDRVHGLQKTLLELMHKRGQLAG